MNNDDKQDNGPRLSEWLKAEMERRNLGHRELADRAGIAHSSVGRALDPEGTVSYTVCYKLAGALNANPVTVLEMAGLLPKMHPNQEGERDLIFLFRQLKPEGKDQALRYLQFLVMEAGKSAG